MRASVRLVSWSDGGSVRWFTAIDTCDTRTIQCLGAKVGFNANSSTLSTLLFYHTAQYSAERSR